MDTLIKYELVENRFHESKHTQVKTTMKKNGYLDHFSCEVDGKKVMFYLPDATLWKKDTLPLQAKNDLIAAAKLHSADVERLIALEFTDKWAAVPGKPYANE